MKDDDFKQLQILSKQRYYCWVIGRDILNRKSSFNVKQTKKKIKYFIRSLLGKCKISNNVNENLYLKLINEDSNVCIGFKKAWSNDGAYAYYLLTRFLED